MKRVSLLALLLAVLIIAGIFVMQHPGAEQTSTGNGGADVAFGDESFPTPIVVATVVTPEPVTGGTPVPTSIESDPVPPVATPLPVPESPDAPQAGPADGVVLGQYDFESGDLSGWTFTQLFDDPVAAAEWTIEDGALAAPLNDRTVAPLNDPIALAPVTLDGDGAVTVQALSRQDAAGRVGIVFGHENSQNFVVLLLSDTGAPTRTGVSLLQVSNDTFTYVAQDESVALAPNSWQLLRVTITGQTIEAIVDDETVLTATLPTPLSGEQVGVYGDFTGSGYFDNLTVFGK